MAKKNLFSLISAFILIAVLLIYILNFTSVGKTPTIGFYKADPEQYSLLLDWIKSSETGLGKKPVIIKYEIDKSLHDQFSSRPVDLLITENFPLDKSWEKLLTPIPMNLLERYPRSTKNSSEYNGTSLLLPLQLDHIELAYKKDFYASTSDNSVIFGFDELQDLLLSQVKDGYYPLILAGADDRDLLDVISVVSLSITGVSGYEKLYNSVLENDDFNEILKMELQKNISLSTILDIFSTWKKQEIIHPEWLRFSRDEAIKYFKDNLGSAFIMRLSVHRTLPDNLLDNLRETPFPFLHKEDRATALVMPGYSLGIYKESPFRVKSQAMLYNLLSNDNQRKLTAQSGLAPATSSSETLDKQSSEVRLWGAASRKILTPLPDNSDLCREVRNYLQFR